MTDQREKRIQEIRENKFDDDTEFLLEEIDRLERVLRATEIGRSNETLLKNEVIRQYEELESELSRLQVERDEIQTKYETEFLTAMNLLQEKIKLIEERDKAIEGLKEVSKWDYHTNPIIHYRLLCDEILSELGVPHDPLD